MSFGQGPDKFVSIENVVRKEGTVMAVTSNIFDDHFIVFTGRWRDFGAVDSDEAKEDSRQEEKKF